MVTPIITKCFELAFFGEFIFGEFIFGCKILKPLGVKNLWVKFHFPGFVEKSAILNAFAFGRSPHHGKARLENRGSKMAARFFSNAPGFYWEIVGKMNFGNFKKEFSGEVVISA